MAPPRIDVDMAEVRQLYADENWSTAQIAKYLEVSPALVVLRMAQHGIPRRPRSGINVGPCTISGCEKPSRARGWCINHYQRWRHHSNPLGGHERHGYNRTLTHRSWEAMLLRCTNPRTNGYEHYGGRGIRVCDEWRRSFTAFLRDVGHRPSQQHSIDRIDVDGHYEPGNVRWATAKEQCKNRRNGGRRA